MSPSDPKFTPHLKPGLQFLTQCQPGEDQAPSKIHNPKIQNSFTLTPNPYKYMGKCYREREAHVCHPWTHSLSSSFLTIQWLLLEILALELILACVIFLDSHSQRQDIYIWFPLLSSLPIFRHCTDAMREQGQHLMAWSTAKLNGWTLNNNRQEF